MSDVDPEYFECPDVQATAKQHPKEALKTLCSQVAIWLKDNFNVGVQATKIADLNILTGENKRNELLYFMETLLGVCMNCP